MKRILLMLTVIVVLIQLVMPIGSAQAATTGTITTTATPSYVSIVVWPTTWAIGTVDASTTYFAAGSTPSWPLNNGECEFHANNTGSVAIDVNIKATDFAGGVGWTLAADPGEDIVDMRAWQAYEYPTEAWCINMTTSNQEMWTSQAASNQTYFELALSVGTFTDGVEKTSTVTLTASAT